MVQLRRLQEQSDEESIARFSGIDPGRLRRALQVAKPRINYVDIGPGYRTESDRRPGAQPPQLTVPPGQTRLRLRGDGLIDRERRAAARLDGTTLPIRSMSQSHMEVELPESLNAGTLQIELPDGTSDFFTLVSGEEKVFVDKNRWTVAGPEEETH
jgi:hypothetical protein